VESSAQRKRGRTRHEAVAANSGFADSNPIRLVTDRTAFVLESIVFVAPGVLILAASWYHCSQSLGRKKIS
jgi:hypothetical protein